MREWIFFLGQAKPSNIKVLDINNPSTKRDIWPAQRGGGQFLTSTFINIVLLCGPERKRGGKGETFTELTKQCTKPNTRIYD